MSFDWKQPYKGVAWQKYTRYKIHTKMIKQASIKEPYKSLTDLNRIPTQQQADDDGPQQIWAEEAGSHRIWAEAVVAAATNSGIGGNDRSVGKHLFKKRKVQRGVVRTADHSRPPGKDLDGSVFFFCLMCEREDWERVCSLWKVDVGSPQYPCECLV